MQVMGGNDHRASVLQYEHGVGHAVVAERSERLHHYFGRSACQQSSVCVQELAFSLLLLIDSEVFDADEVFGAEVRLSVFQFVHNSINRFVFFY